MERNNSAFKDIFLTSELLVQLLTAIYLIKIRGLDNTINSCHRFGELIKASEMLVAPRISECFGLL